MFKIETKNLCKSFPEKFSFKDIINRKRCQSNTVLKNINIKVKPGEIFCIVGPNGAGKTTLIKILCCLILPDSGSAFLNGYNIVKSEYDVKKSIGLVTGYERSFYWRLTGKQNLDFFAKLYSFSSSERKKRLNFLIDFLELSGEINKRYQNCSSGFKQRLLIARALIHNPDILFLDEPTHSLDPLYAPILRNFIKEKLVKEQKKTVFFSTHNLNEAEGISDRIALINKGEILNCRTLKELKSDSGKNTLEEIFNYYINKNKKNVF